MVFSFIHISLTTTTTSIAQSINLTKALLLLQLSNTHTFDHQSVIVVGIVSIFAIANTIPTSTTTTIVAVNFVCTCSPKTIHIFFFVFATVEVSCGLRLLSKPVYVYGSVGVLRQPVRILIVWLRRTLFVCSVTIKTSVCNIIVFTFAGIAFDRLPRHSIGNISVLGHGSSARNSTVITFSACNWLFVRFKLIVKCKSVDIVVQILLIKRFFLLSFRHGNQNDEQKSAQNNQEQHAANNATNRRCTQCGGWPRHHVTKTVCLCCCPWLEKDNSVDTTGAYI